ncbi:MAG: ComF family protein [Rubinisphaera brasiliensis]|uniref:ComF family protein n=1 Tax=Rubinisphaera brasiliensis TaxID=119 RepID=UPI00145F31A1|nr:phosphoribosyltransferase family protein [Rubinisphaera brasiliensis]
MRIPQRRNWLRQVRKTRQQHLLPPAERRKNVRGAYSVHRATGLQGARVLLVDDILTTGSTAQVCTRALLEAGAAEVFVAVLARGLKPR